MIADDKLKAIKMVRRCTKCLLPETMPFIRFDDKGVCNYCHSYKKNVYNDVEVLKEKANQIRKNDGSPDCIVMFSGGRDSSYLLHYVVKELKLHPIAFTYDWGMSTEVGDRNSQKMCDVLGVPRYIVNKDIQKKLANVKKNIKAWCKRPDLGMVPLFMAGDKQFFTEVNKISEEKGIKTVFIGTNPLEKTDFKTGFCSVSPNFNADRIYSLSMFKKMKLMLYYFLQFMRNPSYINSSIFDTFKAFFSFYGSKQEEIDLYKYVVWDEKVVNEVLINQYGWEMDPECKTTWRIGDGTAAFYNYIYYSVAGFTENDTLRSNQIREGMLDRNEAMALAERDNAIRPNSLKWYFNRVGLDMNSVLKVVDGMQTLY